MTKKYEDNPVQPYGVPFFNAVGQEHKDPDPIPEPSPPKREVG